MDLPLNEEQNYQKDIFRDTFFRPEIGEIITNFLPICHYQNFTIIGRDAVQLMEEYIPQFCGIPA